ncbi:hypothetical protein EYF80_050181 [Liparis tanakae]|uniref:Uncharacterized protein n=1 Tax=Liparis tanakae TaxID=230148 RepID=A0A4Z2FFH7_9TELE|nr:hypothetical protein EYF80_050181 [Liparis tanakae]
MSTRYGRPYQQQLKHTTELLLAADKLTAPHSVLSKACCSAAEAPAPSVATGTERSAAESRGAEERGGRLLGAGRWGFLSGGGRTDRQTDRQTSLRGAGGLGPENDAAPVKEQRGTGSFCTFTENICDPCAMFANRVLTQPPLVGRCSPRWPPKCQPALHMPAFAVPAYSCHSPTEFSWPPPSPNLFPFPRHPPSSVSIPGLSSPLHTLTHSLTSSLLCQRPLISNKAASVMTRPMLNHRLRTTDSEGEEVMELRYGQRRGSGAVPPADRRGTDATPRTGQSFYGKGRAKEIVGERKGEGASTI